MINSMLAHYDQSVEHLLPVWQLPSNENWCMIGYHAVPVIADGFLKGVKGFDPQRAYEAVKTTATNPHYDSVAVYDKLGWVPCDKENESISKTLEYAFDDYCVAQMAKALGKTDDYNHFMRRAASYKNIFDPSIGLMRSKDSQGKWKEKFDPHSWETGDVTEGTSWQYSWFVPQDVPGLVALMGGKEKFWPSSTSCSMPAKTRSPTCTDSSASTGTATNRATTSLICIATPASRGKRNSACGRS